MGLLTRKADVTLFYRGRRYMPVSAAKGKFLRSPKIVSCTTSAVNPSGDTFVDAVKMETLGVPSRENANPIMLNDVFVGMGTRLPSNYKVPISLDRNDLPKHVRKLLEETEKQHAFTFAIASFDADPAAKNLLINSVKLRINKHDSGGTEEWMAIFIFSNSRLYSFWDLCRGYLANY